MRRHLKATHRILLERLGGEENIPNLSHRKQLCLSYLLWGVTGKKAHKEIALELLLEWRKVDDRVGGPRSLVERRLRRLIQARRKRKKLAPSREGLSEFTKKQMEEKKGIHDPKLREAQRNSDYHRETVSKRDFGLEWVLTDPYGDEIRVKNLRKYCREHNLNDKHIYSERGWRGWFARKLLPEWEGTSEKKSRKKKEKPEGEG